jgi:hypothetical protein
VTSSSGASEPAAKAVGILFFAEMAISPVVAAVALLVPVAGHWGAYKYVPAIVWFAVFAQCLVTFRWRGLWFLLGPPAAFVAIEVFLLAAPPVPRKQVQATVIELAIPKGTKPAATDTTSGGSVTVTPRIIGNADGTMTGNARQLAAVGP